VVLGDADVSESGIAAERRPNKRSDEMAQMVTYIQIRFVRSVSLKQCS
jgi:hypothetical protein